MKDSLRSTANSRGDFLDFFEFFKILGSQFFSFLAVIQVPGRLEKLREAPGMNFHQGASKSELVGPSYVHFCVFQKNNFTSI